MGAIDEIAADRRDGPYFLLVNTLRFSPFKWNASLALSSYAPRAQERGAARDRNVVFLPPISEPARLGAMLETPRPRRCGHTARLQALPQCQTTRKATLRFGPRRPDGPLGRDRPVRDPGGMFPT